MARLEKNEVKVSESKFIFEGSSNWPVGLAGLVAGKIARKYNVPTVIYHEKGDMVYSSCRSIAQFDLMSAFSKCSEYFNDFGGHKQACGFRMKKNNLDKVKSAFGKVANKELSNVDIESSLDIDVELSLGDISWLNYDNIQKFAPFGRSNLEPVFLIKGAEIIDCRTVGNGHKHLKLGLMIFDKSSGAKKINAIAFGMGDKEGVLKNGSLVDAVFGLIAKEWNNNRNLEMKIIDLRLSE